jgi:hypothetical protein
VALTVLPAGKPLALATALGVGPCRLLEAAGREGDDLASNGRAVVIGEGRRDRAAAAGRLEHRLLDQDGEGGAGLGRPGVLVTGEDRADLGRAGLLAYRHLHPRRAVATGGRAHHGPAPA